MNRFACPSSGLADLATGLRGHTLESPIPVTVIGTTGGDWEANLESDATAMNDFMGACEDKAEIESYEVRLPDHAGLRR